MGKKMGCLYYAIETKYVEEAEISASSLKEHHPNIHVTLVTCDTSTVSNPNQVFDTIIRSESSEFSWENKVRGMLNTPYETTLFLDSDTYVAGDLGPLFELSGKYELAMAHAPYRDSDTVDAELNVPESFPEFNVGVVLYTLTSHVQNLLKSWVSNLNVHSSKWKRRQHDQPAFRKAVYDGSVKYSVLTPEYNCRFIRPGYLHGEARILHGRAHNLSEVAKYINHSKKQRVHIAQANKILIYQQEEVLPASMKIKYDL